MTLGLTTQLLKNVLPGVTQGAASLIELSSLLIIAENTKNQNRILKCGIFEIPVFNQLMF